MHQRPFLCGQRDGFAWGEGLICVGRGADLYGEELICMERSRAGQDMAERGRMRRIRSAESFR